jgi:hypothetical protein
MILVYKQLSKNASTWKLEQRVHSKENGRSKQCQTRIGMENQ